MIGKYERTQSVCVQSDIAQGFIRKETSPSSFCLGGKGAMNKCLVPADHTRSKLC